MKLALALTGIGLIIAGHLLITDLTADLAQPAPAAQAPPAIQENVVQPWHVSRRDAHENVWESVTELPGPLGHPVQHKRRFVELCVGLNMRDTQGTWQPAEARFEITSDGVEATRTAHSVRLPSDIATPFGVEITMPGGAKLRSHPLSVSYYDPVTGACVLLGVVTNATGWLVGSNQVVYSNCFAGLHASIAYHLTLGGIAQDVLLDAQTNLPPPAEFGLSEQTRLEVMTEFDTRTPAPQVVEHVLSRETRSDVRPRMVEPDFLDSALTFGSMRMQVGQAFILNQRDTDAPSNGPRRAPVGKSYRVLDGRPILIEGVDYRTLKPMLQRVSADSRRTPPEQKDQWAMREPLSPEYESQTTPSRSHSPRSLLAGRAAMLRTIHTPRMALRAKLPTIQRASLDKPLNPILAAQVLVMDYDLLLTTNVMDYTFRADTTYYVDGEVDLGGNTTIEGNTVIKLDPDPNAASSLFQCGGTVICKTGPYRPAVFTLRDDDTVGEILPQSTHNLPTDFPFTVPLTMVFCEEQPILHHLRFSHADTAVDVQFTDCSISHIQFNHVRVPYHSVGGSISVRNALLSRADHAFDFIYDGTGTFEHLTIDQCPSMGWNGTVSTAFTNCLLVGVTDWDGFATAAERVESLPAGSPVFAKVGGGSHYLAEDSPYRDSGTANINPDLAHELATMTTHGPTVYSNQTITVATVLGPGPRDTGAPALGYHYDPLDYAFGGVTANAVLTFEPGTAVGWFRTSSGWNHAGHGIHIGDQKILTFNGTVEAPDCWVRCNTVQEGGTGLWDGGYGPGGITGWANQYLYNVSLSPEVHARFTRFSMMAGDGNHARDDYGYLIVRATDCEFYSGGLGVHHHVAT